MVLLSPFDAPDSCTPGCHIVDYAFSGDRVTDDRPLWIDSADPDKYGVDAASRQTLPWAVQRIKNMM